MANLLRQFKRLNNNRTRPAAHKLVADTAEALAHAAYEVLMLDNVFYSEWKKFWPKLGSKELEEKWVSERWSWFLVEARKQLGGLLATQLPEDQKEIILEALILDASLLSNTPVQNRTALVGAVREK